MSCIRQIDEDVYEYISPIDESGKPYWVPFVVKNKDTLIGFLKGKIISNIVFDMVLESLNINISLDTEYLTLDSKRFTDLLPSGKRLRDLTESEIQKQLEDEVKKSLEYYDSENPENQSGILDESLMSIDCPKCGGYYQFNEEHEIPSEDFSCSICGSKLIQYTGVDDSKIKYDGK